jgi:hypothetical protein
MYVLELGSKTTSSASMTHASGIAQNPEKIVVEGQDKCIEDTGLNYKVSIAVCLALSRILS